MLISCDVIERLPGIAQDRLDRIFDVVGDAEYTVLDFISMPLDDHDLMFVLNRVLPDDVLVQWTAENIRSNSWQLYELDGVDLQSQARDDEKLLTNYDTERFKHQYEVCSSMRFKWNKLVADYATLSLRLNEDFTHRYTQMREDVAARCFRRDLNRLANLMGGVK